MPSTDKIISITLRLNDEMSKSLDKSANSLKKLGDNLTSIGTKMTVGITAPLVAFGATAVKSFMEFDSAMKEIEVRSGATGEEMAKLRQLALDMGRDTVFSATDAAQAIQELEASGASVTEIFAQIKPVMDLAASGNLELADAADSLTNILKMYNLEASESVNVADLLNQAASASSASVSDLALAFNNAGTVMAQFGLSMGESAAALAILSDIGVKGAEAGTQMRSMLLNMQRGTEPVNEAWRTLGVSMYDAQGNMRDIDDIFKDINKAMEDMNMKEQNRITQDLAGSYGIVAFNALRASNGIAGMAAAMDLEATAAEIAEAKSKTLAGRWEGLMGSIETLQLVLAELAQGPLTELIFMLTQVVNWVTEWARTNPQLAQMVLIILGIVAALGPLLIFIGQIIGAITAIQGAIAAFAGIGIAISAPIMAAIALIVAVIAVLWAVVTNFMNVQSVITRVGFAIGDAFKSMANTLMSAGAELLSWPAKILEGWKMLGARIGVAVLEIGTKIVEGVGAWLSQAWTAFQQLLALIGKFVGDFLMLGITLGKAVIKGLIQGFVSMVTWLLQKIGEVANEIAQTVRNALGIASPSKVMMKIGEQTAEGFYKGVESMGGVGVNVAGTSGGMSANPTLSAAGAGGGAVNNYYFQPAPGTTAQQGEEIYRYVKKRLGDDAKKQGAKTK